MKYVYERFESIPYVIRFPDGFSKENKHPLILFLHGMGGRVRTTTIEGFEKIHFFALSEGIPDFPFICVAPRCDRFTWFDRFETLTRFIEDLSARSYTDKDRIYLMGASMGGFTVWQLAMSMPDRFAAIVPICGGGIYGNADRLKNTPVWAFHGGKDRTVFPEESQKMVDAVNRSGGKAKLTIYPENGHDAWSDTLRNPEVYQWLLTHSLKERRNEV